MYTEELERLVDEILLKKTRGEELTPREENILAYAYSASGCAKCGR